MAGTFQTNGAITDNTTEGRGKGATGSWAGGEGGLSTGIGIGSNSSGPAFRNFSPSTVDVLPTRIGGGVLSSPGSSNSDSNIANIVINAVGVAGTGYTNGVYLLESTGGGRAAGTAQVQVTVTGGGISAVDVTRPGDSFTSVPTFSTATIPAGTGGAVTAVLGRDGDLEALGFGVNKGTRYLIASGTVAVNAAVAAGYLNRSGRTMVAGDGTWAVAP